jgi:hypothetical protein
MTRRSRGNGVQTLHCHRAAQCQPRLQRAHEGRRLASESSRGTHKSATHGSGGPRHGRVVTDARNAPRNRNAVRDRPSFRLGWSARVVERPHFPAAASFGSSFAFQVVRKREYHRAWKVDYSALQIRSPRCLSRLTRARSGFPRPAGPSRSRNTRAASRPASRRSPSLTYSPPPRLPLWSAMRQRAVRPTPSFQHSPTPRPRAARLTRLP